MAAADYRLCDVCSRKAFYDSNLNYDFDNRDEHGNPKLDYVGDWAVICDDCAKTHACKVMKRDAVDRVNKLEASIIAAGREMVKEQIDDTLNNGDGDVPDVWHMSVGDFTVSCAIENDEIVGAVLTEDADLNTLASIKVPRDEAAT